jgi:hypothetical protein
MMLFSRTVDEGGTDDKEAFSEVEIENEDDKSDDTAAAVDDLNPTKTKPLNEGR